MGHVHFFLFLLENAFYPTFRPSDVWISSTYRRCHLFALNGTPKPYNSQFCDSRTTPIRYQRTLNACALGYNHMEISRVYQNMQPLNWMYSAISYCVYTLSAKYTERVALVHDDDIR